jgi:hypothetical protein
MSPTPQGIGAAIAKTLKGRAIVRDVYGPFAGAGETVYRVSLNNGALMQIAVKELPR